MVETQLLQAAKSLGIKKAHKPEVSTSIPIKTVGLSKYPSILLTKEDYGYVAKVSGHKEYQARINGQVLRFKG